jgi:hypothetical protein
MALDDLLDTIRGKTESLLQKLPMAISMPVYFGGMWAIGQLPTSVKHRIFVEPRGGRCGDAYPDASMTECATALSCVGNVLLAGMNACHTLCSGTSWTGNSALDYSIAGYIAMESALRLTINEACIDESWSPGSIVGLDPTVPLNLCHIFLYQIPKGIGEYVWQRIRGIRAPAVPSVGN